MPGACLKIFMHQRYTHPAWLRGFAFNLPLLGKFLVNKNDRHFIL
jgi:hypothetical protein